MITLTRAEKIFDKIITDKSLRDNSSRGDLF